MVFDPSNLYVSDFDFAMFECYSYPIRVHHNLCGGVPSSAVIRTDKQYTGNEVGRSKIPQVLQAARSAEGEEHRCMVHHT